jgi:hypothetical protein
VASRHGRHIGKESDVSGGQKRHRPVSVMVNVGDRDQASFHAPGLRILRAARQDKAAADSSFRETRLSLKCPDPASQLPVSRNVEMNFGRRSGS